jgi:solute carrier family 35 protein E1
MLVHIRPWLPPQVSVPLLAFYLIMWYALNVQYNLYNKKILNIFPYPYTTALIQLASGVFYILPVWVLGLGGRSFPKNFKPGQIATLAAFHGGGHFATVMSLGAGSVAFANVVKAAEPLCSVLMGVIMLGSFPKLMEVGALLPIIGGVMIASMAEPEFSMLAFGCAMLSNFLFAARGVLGKIIMSGGSKMSGADTFAINTLFAMAIMAPVTYYMEGAIVMDGFNKSVPAAPRPIFVTVDRTCLAPAPPTRTPAYGRRDEA